MISVQFLRNIAVGLDPSAAQSALYHLLWNTVSEDFEIRSKVTSIIKVFIQFSIYSSFAFSIHFSMQFLRSSCLWVIQTYLC